MSGFIADVFSAPDLRGVGLIAGKTAVVFIVLVVGLRLAGKRELGQMTIVDLVLIVVLGNAVQNAMLNGDNSLGGGIVSVSVLLAMNKLMSVLLSRSHTLERFLVGEPAVLVNDRQVQSAAMKRHGITRDQLLAALREHGIDSLDQVHLAILEVDGTISVVPIGSPVLRTRRHYRGVRLP